MVDVLLTHSYHLYYDRKQAVKMQPYPPLGTLYSAALLREHGYSVAVFDTMLEDPRSGFPRVLRRYKPRIVALCEDNFNFLSKMCLGRMREVALGMIAASREAGASVLVNGSDAADHLTQYLQGGANFIIVGEPERTILEAVSSLTGNSGHDPEMIPGLIFLKQPAGKLIRTPRRPLLNNLDQLPLPARDLVDLDRYRDAWRGARNFFSLNLVAGRGCPYRCNWCAKPIFGDAFHSRSARAVAEEMALLKNRYGAEHLWFADDIFGLKNRWVTDLADHVSCLGAVLPFKMQTRADLIQEDVANALRNAGCSEAWMGVESGSQKILDAMEKGLRVDEVIKARNHLRNAGIRACFFLQFGYSGETWQDIRQTIELVRATKPDDIGVSVSYPLPGTRFYDKVGKQLGLKRNWVDSEDLSMMFQGTYTSRFYRALHDALHAEVETWSSPPADRAGRGSSGTLPRDADAERVELLWAKVEEMEKTCRNKAPTPLQAVA
jgi:anaerobic magnesium-protoporphyrin IX monomethyl ester cyclase